MPAIQFSIFNSSYFSLFSFICPALDEVIPQHIAKYNADMAAYELALKAEQVRLHVIFLVHALAYLTCNSCSYTCICI